MKAMIQLPKLRPGGFFALALSVLWLFQGCAAPAKDPFALTSRDVDKNGEPLGDGYAWSFGNLGFMLNGHGLPDHRRTFVITHKIAGGKTELIWPVFLYGDNQANAVVFDHTLVFTAMLPDGRSVLMGQRAGEPPMVISAAVLRLAAQRLGTSIIVPGTDYYFTKVRLPPDRIWLKGQPVSSTSYPARGVFSVELNTNDLMQVMNETRRTAKLNKAIKFDYLATEGAPCHIDSKDAEEIGALSAPANPRPTTATIHRTTHYDPQNERLYGDALLDAAGRYAYFSTTHEPGRILKVALGTNPQTPPAVVGAAVLEPEEDNTFNAVMDPQGGCAYFGTDFPGHVVKIALGNSNEPPYRVGSVLLDASYNVRVGVVDGATGHGYFCVGNRLFKIRLGRADEPPTVVSQIELPNGTTSIASAVLDPATHYAWFGSDLTEIYKVALGVGDAPPKFVGELKLPEDEFGLRGALIEPNRGCAWFASQTGSLIKISLGAKDNPPRRLGALKLDSRFQYLEHTFGMDNAGYAYFGTVQGGKTGDPDCCVGAVLKIALGTGDDLPRLVSFLPLPPDETYVAEGIVDPAHRILCLGIGAADCSLLKLSLGEGDAPPKILARTPLYSK